MIEKLKLQLQLLSLCPYQFKSRPETLDHLELMLVAKETVRATRWPRERSASSVAVRCPAICRAIR